ncbi:unnamed protein product [Calypogeia fissa]
MGVTTVPLPAFWSSSKNEGDQFRRSPRKEHPCQNPRCAANNINACSSTPYLEPPMKRSKDSFKTVKPGDNGCPFSSYETRTESEFCGGIKAQGRGSGKHYADCNVASSPKPTETCGGIMAHGRCGGKYADCKIASSPGKPSEVCGGIKAQGRYAGKYADCNVASSRRELCSVYSNKGSPGINPGEFKTSSGTNDKESQRSTGINSRDSTRLTGSNPRESTISTGKNCKESTRLKGMDLKESIRSAKLNSQDFARSIGKDSIESSTSISSSSHAPSISTPHRNPPKPNKMGLASLFVQKESTSTGSSTPGCSQGTLQSIDRPIADENPTPSFLRSGRVAPPNSEKDEEELPSIEECNWLKPSVTLPPFHELPVESSLTSRWLPLETKMDPITRPVNPTNYSPTPLNALPVGSSSMSTWPQILPADTLSISKSANVPSKNDSPPSKLPAAPIITSFTATIPLEATTNGIRGTPMCCSSSPTVNKLPEGHISGSGFRQGPSNIEHGKCRTTPARPKNRESDLSTRSSTIAKMSNAAQMCILEQRLEDEDHTSHSSSLNTSESRSIEPSSTLRGAKPVSAFYNALYAPDCTWSSTKALEAHFLWQKRSADRKLRVALEIAMLSAMVTILLVVFYPAVTRGLRSHFYGCCSCPPAAPATAASRNPSQHYSQLKSSIGCVYRGQNSWNCPLEQQRKGSTVVK